MSHAPLPLAGTFHEFSVGVEDVHPVDIMWLIPRNPKRIESSLASVPIVEVGIVYTLHCLMWPV